MVLKGLGRRRTFRDVEGSGLFITLKGPGALKTIIRVKDFVLRATRLLRTSVSCNLVCPHRGQNGYSPGPAGLGDGAFRWKCASSTHGVLSSEKVEKKEKDIMYIYIYTDRVHLRLVSFS